MKIEVHVLQNFAPSNLNRDDTGAPKDCELGGYRRARISSQCQKRAVRELFRLEGLLSEDDLATRTKRLVHQVADVLVEKFGHSRESAAALAIGAIEGVGFKRNVKGEGEDLWKTEYLLFVPRRIINAFAELLHEHREVLNASVASEPQEGGEGAKGKKTSKKEAKSSAKAAYPKEVRERVERLLEDTRSTVDLALFGRMIADRPAWNVEASCQVAHAISTNRVQMDFDFYTAVDDFRSDDNAGSDMMGTIQFNSSCFYRYAVLDVEALRRNLDVDKADLLSRSVDAFVRAFVTAIPTGKQNSMAAHNFPSYVLGLVRERGQPLSLSNAFLKPARPSGERDLVDDSVEKLERYYARMVGVMDAPPHLAISWADRDLDAAEGSAKGLVRSNDLKEFYASVTRAAIGARS